MSKLGLKRLFLVMLGFTVILSSIYVTVASYDTLNILAEIVDHPVDNIVKTYQFDITDSWVDRYTLRQESRSPETYILRFNPD